MLAAKMAEVSTTSNTTSPKCNPTIDGRVFDLGCLGPALAIILILAFLKRRKNLMLEYCNGYPGLVIPINFLGTFEDRFTIAATFGATATTCLDIFLDGKTGLFTLGGPAWVKVFQGLIAVLVYGILFYPFFACLTTNYNFVGSLLGFLYAVLRFSFKLGIDFQCINAYEGDARTLLYLGVLSVVPTHLCLLFIVIRFAVLLCLEVREKRLEYSGNTNRAERTGSTCLVAGKPEIEHVTRLLNPGLNMGLADVKWYMKPLYFIYQPRPDFKYSTQLISTLVVAGIIIFQILVAFLSLFDFLKKQCMLLCPNDTCKNICGVTFDSTEAAFVVCSLFSVMLLLHFMKCHRKHVLQLYRGQRTFYQDVFVSPAKLVGRSLRFSGYQIAYTMAGYFVMASFLTFVCLILGFVFKYIKVFVSPAMFIALKNVGEGMLPTVGMVVFLWLFQLFLTYFVFRDRDFPNITITVDNRRFFSIMSYFFFFYNILLGIFSSFLRIFKGMLLGVVFLSRIDRTFLMQGFQNWDPAFVAYLGFINVLVAHSHPVMLMFCQLLINRNKDRGLEDSLPRMPSVQREASEIRSAIGTKQTTSYGSTVYNREGRLPRLSHKAFNRWHVAVMLLRNPSLIKYRKRGGVRSVVRLQGSINDDISALI